MTSDPLNQDDLAALDEEEMTLIESNLPDEAAMTETSLPVDESAPISSAHPSNSSAFATYNTIAETIGMVPSFRKKDNIIQAIVIGMSTCVGVIIGGALQGSTGAIVAAMTGLILSLLLSGFVLMLVGWVRAIKETREHNY